MTTRKRPNGLTLMQKRFVQYYAISLNASEAAEKAGYSPKTVAVQASRMLTRVKIQDALTKELEKRSKRTEIDQDFVIRKLRDNLDMAMDPMTYNPSAVNRALELLGKHVGMFSDKIQHTGKDGAPIEVAVDYRITLEARIALIAVRRGQERSDSEPDAG